MVVVVVLLEEGWFFLAHMIEFAFFAASCIQYADN